MVDPAGPGNGDEGIQWTGTVELGVIGRRLFSTGQTDDGEGERERESGLGKHQVNPDAKTVDGPRIRQAHTSRATV